MWKIMICDDEPEFRDQIRQSLEDYQRKNGVSFSVSACGSGEELLQVMAADTDVLLLDIKMKDMTGMEAARELRRRGSPVLIVFITTMTQYALEGYQVHAYGFLKKPLSPEQLHWQMTEILAHLQKKRGRQVLLSTNFRTDVVNSREIVYAEAYGHDLHLMLADGTGVTHDLPLSELEKRLPQDGFFRCHKSYLVNMSHVKQIGLTELLLEGDVKVPLSRHRRKDFLCAFAKFSDWREA